MNNNTTCLTNFYPINLEFDEYTILQIPSKEGLLRELRDKHNSTHSFFKHGDFIYASNKEGEDLDFGGKIVTLSTIGDEKITSSLIKHIFFRTFKDRFQTIVPTQFYPFRIISRNRGDDIIYNALPKPLQGHIAFKKQIDLHLRLIDIKGKPTFGFVISIDRKWIFKIDCEVLQIEGFDLIGREVLHSVELPGLSGILAPDQSFLGIIKEVQKSEAIVDTNEGDQRIPLNELFIRKTTRNMKDYLTFKLGENESKKIFKIISAKKE
ncbi:MAG: Piwi domain protein, partial [Ignavibacteriales bacterium]|nr:Piwi domain protein [Ignavibacteriales bacterium]